MDFFGTSIPGIETTARIYSLTTALVLLLPPIVGLWLICSARLAGQAAILRDLACDPMVEASFSFDRIDTAERRYDVLWKGVKFARCAAFGALLLSLILVMPGGTSIPYIFAVPVVSLGVLALCLLSFVQFTRDVNLAMAEVHRYRLFPAELAVSSDSRFKKQYACYSTGTT